MQRFCWMCGKAYETKRSHSRFCSSTCRSRDCRERHYQHKPWSETLIKRYQTKHNQVHLATCCQCNKTYFINGAQKMSMYCSNHCRYQARYQRREYKRKVRQMELWGYEAYVS